MSLKIRNTTVFLIIGLMLFTLASSAAFAASRVEVGSRVTLSQSDPFHGKVFSKRDDCERNRTVEVYLVRPNADGFYGSTRSNTLGEWSMAAGMPNGDFYAVAKVRSIDKGTKTIFCKRAVSPTVSF